MLMDITVAYFHPLLHPETVKRDFSRLRAAGAGSIVYAVHEQEEQRLQRDLERGLHQAQDAGLKVHLSLGRYGNLFAGPALVPSWYTFRHPHSRVMDRHGRYHDVACFNHVPFRSWLFKEIEHYLTTYPINGIFLDEPRGTDITCFCSVCRALCPDVTDLLRFRRRSMIDFLSDLCACVKRIDAHAKTTIVLKPNDLQQLEEVAAILDLDTIGCHLFRNSSEGSKGHSQGASSTLLRLHAPSRLESTQQAPLRGATESSSMDVTEIEKWSRSVVAVAHQQKKRSQLWLQNFNLDEEAEKQLESTFTLLMSAEPDELACYYYWRNNANPMSVWQTTLDLLRRIPRRQLYWQASKACEQGKKDVSS
jgi:hypothetical protein